MFGQLIPQGGGDSVPLLKSKLLVGRRESCDIRLAFPNVSSHHCELELIGGYWRIRDLNSSNGIKVNGERCTEKTLRPGDLVSISKHQYEIQFTPSADAPPPNDIDEDPFAKSLLEKAGLESTPRRRPNRQTSSGAMSSVSSPLESPTPRTANRKAPTRSDVGDDDVSRWLYDEPT